MKEDFKVEDQDEPVLDFDEDNPVEELDEDDDIALYEVKARLRSLHGNIRSEHFRAVDSYIAVCKRVASSHPTMLKEEVQLAVELFLTELLRTVIVDGKGVEISKFGTFKPLPKAAKKRYQPNLGAYVWTPAGARLGFTPSEKLKKYFRKYGKSIYGRLAARKKEADELKAKRNALKDEKARLEGWQQDIYLLPVEELSPITLRHLERKGKLQDRIKLQEEHNLNKSKEFQEEFQNERKKDEKELAKGTKKD